MARLSRFAFYVVLMVVGVGVAVYLPEPRAVGTTPSAPWITFSQDRSATAIRRHLKRAHHAEAEADRLRARGSLAAARRLYRVSRGHYDVAARHLLEHNSRKGYLYRTVLRGRRRVARKGGRGSGAPTP